MADNPSSPSYEAAGRHLAPCLDDLVTLDISHKNQVALVWDRGEGLPACWTYGEVQTYASGVTRRLSQLCLGRQDGRSVGGSGADTAGVFRPLPYVGVYAESYPELPAMVLGILQSQCVFMPIPAPNTTSGLGCLDSVLKLGVVHVLVHLDVVGRFLSLPEVQHMCKDKKDCVIDLDWIKYGFVMVALSHGRKKELSEEEPLKADQFCARDYFTASSYDSVPCCKDVKDAPVIKPVVYARSHPHKSASIAYVMHTSGTTGASVPVHVPHCCITPNVMDLRRRFGIRPDDMVFNAAPVTFDPAIVEIFLALSCGAALLMVPEHVKRSPKLLSNVLFGSNSATVLQITPSLATLLGEQILSDDVLGRQSHVRVLAFGGEKCPGCKRIAKWKHPQNSTRVFNLYGITEVSSWSSCHEVTEEDLTPWRGGPSSPGNQVFTDGVSVDAVCIGEPLLNTRLEVFGAVGSRLSAEQPGEGEIWLGGRGRVCLVGEEEEAGLDVMRPSGDVGVVDEKGRVYCLGRRDFQVKRFGHRVSLEGVEQVILSVLEYVVSACVLTEVATAGAPSALPQYRGNPGDFPDYPHSLVLFVEPDQHYQVGNAMGWTQKIHQQLSSSLPSHTVPDHVVIVGEVPVTSHGKVDRERLVQDWLRDRVVSQQEMVPSSLQPVSLEQVVLGLQQLAETHFQIKWELDLKLTSDCGLDSFSVLRLSNMIRDRFPILDRLHEGMSLLDELLKDDLQAVSEYLVPLISQEDKSTCTTPLKEGGKTTLDPTVKEEDETSFKEGEGSQPSLVSHGGENSCSLLEDWSDGPEAKIASSPSAKRCKHVGLCGMEGGSPSGACVEEFHCWRRGQYFCGNRLQVPLFHQLSPQPSKNTNLHLRVKWSVDTGKCVDASPLVVQLSPSPTPSLTPSPTLHTPCSMVYIGSHSGHFLAINWESGLVLWRAVLGDRIESSATMSACGGYVVVGCYDGHLYVLDAKSGSLYWKCRLSEQQPIKSSPCVDMATGLIWCGSHDQHLYALNLEERTVVHRLHLGGGSCFSSPCLDHHLRTLYIATLNGTVVAVDTDSGSIRWRHSCPKPVFSSPTLLLSHDVAFGSVDGMCYVLNSQGELVGSMETLKPIFSSICVVSFEEDTPSSHPPTPHPLPLLLFGSHDHKLYCCCVTAHSEWHKTLKTLWTFTTESPVYATPCVSLVHGMACVCCVCSTGLLHLLELSSGAVLGLVQLPGEVFSSPVVRGGCIVVGCRDDKVYSVDIRIRS